MGLSQSRAVNWAAQDGRVGDLVYHLQQAGKDVLNPSPSSPTKRAPIHLAADRGHTKCVKVLYDAGSTLDVKDKDGYTPLHLAVSKQQYSTVQLLLELGANVNATTRFDVTPLHLATSVGHTPCVELLVRYGAHINAQESWGQTPLSIATLGGRLVTIKSLLRLGADPEIKDYQHSQAPLHIACASKDEERVLILLDAGCDVHSTDGVGRSPLGVAILNKFYRVVPLLLEYGASLNGTDRSMLSPALQQYLDQQRAPLPLARMCRVKLRKYLGPCRVSGELDLLKLQPHTQTFLTSILELCEGQAVQKKAVEGVPIVKQMMIEN